MIQIDVNRALLAERFFADLYAKSYLSGFVFHSPMVTNDPKGRREAGDVVLWVRDILIVFEIVWKNTDLSDNTRKFIRRVGEKRDQLLRDYETYADANTEISMTNENGENIPFDHQYFNPVAFCGIAIVDSELQLEKIHFQTIKKTLDCGFSMAVMTKRDFLDLLLEVDTPADLHYYVADRTRFLRQVFESDAPTFLDLNQRIERELIGFYKLNNNSFPVDIWHESLDKQFWETYQTNFADRIAARDAENQESFVIDRIIELVRKENRPGLPTFQHAAELASLMRRARAGWVASRVRRGFEQMVEGRRERHFAFYNQATKCWVVFYFCYGLTSEEFRQKAVDLSKMKVQLERVRTDFPHSVFCYAFRKSLIDTGNTFDEVLLVVEDAKKYPTVSVAEYSQASQYFRPGPPMQIQEFPSRLD